MPFKDYNTDEEDDDQESGPKPAKPNQQIKVAGLKDALSGSGYVPDAPVGFGGGGYTHPQGDSGGGNPLTGFMNKITSISKLGRGGLIRKPTVAMVGEAGPEAVIPLSQPVEDQEDQLQRYQGLSAKRHGDMPIPEAPETLNIQVGQLGKGLRKMVLFTPGAQAPKRPDGIRQMRVAEGTVYYDPVMITPQEIKSASDGGNIQSILGDSEEGYGAPGKESLKGEVAAVTAHDAGGMPSQDIATDAYHMPKVVAISQKLKPPGGGVIIHSPHEALQMRLRAHTLKKMAGGGYGDPNDPQLALTGEAGPEADINLDDDPAEQKKTLAYLRSLVMPDSASSQRMEASRNVLENRTPGYVPKSPSIWQRLASGAVGAAAGYSNASGRRMQPIDPSGAEQNILYPDAARKSHEYDLETKRLEGAYGKDRQAEQDKFTQLGKIGQYEGILSSIADRKDKQVQARGAQADRQQAERDRFQAGGGQFSPTAPQTTNAPGLDVPQVQGPGESDSGLVTPGNIKLDNRPQVKNPDGSVSTVRTIGIEQDGKYVNIPTVVNGKVLSNQDAIAHFNQTGEHLGVYRDQASRDAAAQKLHESEAAKVTPRPFGQIGGEAPPEVQAPGVMITPSNPAPMSGKLGTPEGFNDVPGVKTDPAGYRRIQETPEHKERQKYLSDTEDTPKYILDAYPGAPSRLKPAQIQGFTQAIQANDKAEQDRISREGIAEQNRVMQKQIHDDSEATRKAIAAGKNTDVGTWSLQEDASGNTIEYNSKTGQTHKAEGIQPRGTHAKADAADEKTLGPIRDSMMFAKSYLEGGQFTGPNDESLVENFFNATKPSTGFRMNQAQIQLLLKAQSLKGRLQATWGHIVGGTILGPEQRAEMAKAIQDMGEAKIAAAKNRVQGGQGDLGGVTKPTAAVPSSSSVPPAVQTVLKTAGPGIHTLSDGSVWIKAADGTISKQ